MPMETGQHGSLIRQDVAEHVVGDHHVELLGRAHQLHAAALSTYIWGESRRPGSPSPPLPPLPAGQLAGGEDVGLVHRAEPVVAHAGRVETDAGGYDGFRSRCTAGCRRPGARAVLQHALLAGLAEADAAGQFADDEDVQPGDHFRLQAGGRGQLRIEDGRTQVGEQAQLRANLQQTALGTDIAFDPVPLRPPTAPSSTASAWRALQGLVGQRHAVLVDGCAPPMTSSASSKPSWNLSLASSSTLTASAMISGPIPSPGRTRICLLITPSCPSFIERRACAAAIEPSLPTQLQHQHVGAERAVVGNLEILLTSSPTASCRVRIAWRNTSGVRIRSTHDWNSRRRRWRRLPVTSRPASPLRRAPTRPASSCAHGWCRGAARRSAGRCPARPARAPPRRRRSPPAGLEHPPHLAQGQADIAPVMGGIATEDEIELAVGEGQALRLALFGTDVRHAPFRGALRHHGEHLGGKIVGHHLLPGRRPGSSRAGAAAQVEDPRFRAPGQASRSKANSRPGHARRCSGRPKPGRRTGAGQRHRGRSAEPTPGEKPGALLPRMRPARDSRGAQRNSQGCCWR